MIDQKTCFTEGNQHDDLLPQSVIGPAVTSLQASVPRVGLIGVHGYGALHLDKLLRLQDEGRLELVAVADPRPPESGWLGSDVAAYASLDELLASGADVDIVVIATPMHTHTPLAVAAMEAGADIYLEKPAAPSWEQYQGLLRAAERYGRVVQVGFQALGSMALPAIDALIESGLGAIRGISATGMWVRDKAYYDRSAWAGHRTLDGADVVDGVATNPLAHSLAMALRIARADTVNTITSIDADLYRAHDIEADDTAVIRIRTHDGPTITCGLTLCAAESSEPRITIDGTEGQAVLYYTQDILDVDDVAGSRRLTFERRDLFENLLDHRANGTQLLSPLERTGAFTQVVEAVRLADDPKPIGDNHVTWVGSGAEAHPVIAGIENLIERSTTAQATFSELGPAWARPHPDPLLLNIAGRPVAQYRDGTHIRADSSPRPYLHPVSTLSGTTVTDHLPLDHVWHLGAGVAIQDVDGINFWGGRTYRRHSGYIWGDDHGTVSRRQPADDRPGGTTLGGEIFHNLDWTGPDGQVLLTEQRSWACSGVDDTTWKLTLNFTLHPTQSESVTLGSPGSNGCAGSGYGGFFWRMAPCSLYRVHTPNADGESGVHGQRAPWIAWEAGFNGGTGTIGGRVSGERAATLIFLAPPQAPDPWFVRTTDYPAIGSSLAWDSPVVTSAEAPLTRTITVYIADGTLSEARIAELAAAK